MAITTSTTRREHLPSEPADPPQPVSGARDAQRSPRGRKNLARQLGRWVKRGLLALAALLVVALIVVAWLPKPVEVDVTGVVQQPMRVTVDEDGRTRVKDRYVVSAPLDGRLARIDLHPGDQVKEGTLLARIVPATPPLLDERSQASAEAQVAAAAAAVKRSKAQIARAEASLEYAESEAKRTEKLGRAGVAAPSDVERARLEVRTARAELDSLRFAAQVAAHELRMAKAALGHLTGKDDDDEHLEISAPVTGVVLKVMQESEGVVAGGTPLLELGDPGALEVVVDVLTRDGIRIRPGAQAEIDRWGGDPLDAHVRLVEPAAFTRVSALGVEEQRVNVILDLDSPRAAWASLGDGYRVEAHIVVWQADDVVQVPTSAAFRHGDGWAVFVVDDGAARLTPITIAHRTGHTVEVVSGLDASQTVVLHPSDRVTDGVAVKPRRSADAQIEG